MTPKLNEHPPTWDGALWVGIGCGIVGFAVLVVGLCHVAGWVLKVIAQAAQP